MIAGAAGVNLRAPEKESSNFLFSGTYAGRHKTCGADIFSEKSRQQQFGTVALAPLQYLRKKAFG